MAVREGPVLAATLTLTTPLPVPVAPLVMASQDAVLAALQPQPEVPSTLTVEAPPMAWNCV
jgi:hypothetical protein